MVEKDSDEMLKERYASGKITRKQYLDMKADLSGDESSAPSNRFTKRAASSSSAPAQKGSKGYLAVKIVAALLVILFLFYLLGLSTSPTAPTSNQNIPTTIAYTQTQTLFNSGSVTLTQLSSTCQPPSCGNVYYDEFTVPANSSGAVVSGSFSSQHDTAVAILTPGQYAEFKDMNATVATKGCGIITTVSVGKNDSCTYFVAVLTGLSSKYLPSAAVFSLYYNNTPIPGYSNLTIRPSNTVNVTYNNYLLNIFVNQTSAPSSPSWAQVRMNVSAINGQQAPALTWLYSSQNDEYFTFNQTADINVQLAAGTYYMIFYYPSIGSEDLTINNPITFSYNPESQPNGQGPNGNQPNGNPNNPVTTTPGGTETGGTLPGVGNSTWSGTAVLKDQGPPDCTYGSKVILRLNKNGNNVNGELDYADVEVTAQPAPDSQCDLTLGPLNDPVTGTISSSAIYLNGAVSGIPYAGGITTDLITLTYASPQQSAEPAAPGEIPAQCVSGCGYSIVVKLIRNS